MSVNLPLPYWLLQEFIRQASYYIWIPDYHECGDNGGGLFNVQETQNDQG